MSQIVKYLLGLGLGLFNSVRIPLKKITMEKGTLIRKTTLLSIKTHFKA